MSAWTATWLFALSLLPGTLAKIIKRMNGPQKDLNGLLLWSLSIRKHVGLLGLYFLFIHACLMLLLYNSSYYGHIFRRRGETMESWRYEWTMFMAVVSTSFFIIVGIASLPSVGLAMNKAHWDAIFGRLIWFALMTGLLHIIFLGSDNWDEDQDSSPYAWARGMPPVTLMATLIPLLVLFIKFVSMTLALVVWVVWLVRGGPEVGGAVAPVDRHESA